MRRGPDKHLVHGTWMTEAEAAEKLGRSRLTVRHWRYTHRRPDGKPALLVTHRRPRNALRVGGSAVLESVGFARAGRACAKAQWRDCYRKPGTTIPT